MKYIVVNQSNFCKEYPRIVYRYSKNEGNIVVFSPLDIILSLLKVHSVKR